METGLFANLWFGLQTAGTLYNLFYCFIGALLGRFHRAKVAMPGGCNFGVRPIDRHIKGFELLGSTVTIGENAIIDAAAERLEGSPVYFDEASVGATVNVILAAVKAKGLTVIENAAKEPQRGRTVASGIRRKAR